MNAVILDFDGTIADSFNEVLDFLLSKAGRQPNEMSAEDRQQLRGLSMRELAIHVGIPTWRLVFVYFQGKAALTRRMHRVPVFAGMEAVISRLHQENYQLYIISSNSRRNIQRFLTEHGLSGYFGRVYGNVGWFGKARALRRALKQNNLEAEKTVYVGDEIRDVIGARLAGMPSVAVSWGFSSSAQLLNHSPTVLVRRPEELQNTLIDWGKSV